MEHLLLYVGEEVSELRKIESCLYTNQTPQWTAFKQNDSVVTHQCCSLDLFRDPPNDFIPASLSPASGITAFWSPSTISTSGISSSRRDDPDRTAITVKLILRIHTQVFLDISVPVNTHLTSVQESFRV